MSNQSTRTGKVLGLVCLSLCFAAAIVAVRAADAPRTRAGGPSDQLVLNKNDHVAIVGNALPDRMQHDGYFEALLYARLPQHDLVFRNLSAASDEVATWHRSDDFGTRDEWLTKVKADVILAFYGYNESFKGDAGLPQFKTDLAKFITDTSAKNYSGKGKPRLVLFSPIAAERNQDPNFPDPAPINANLKKYVAAMAEVAEANRVLFVDLFSSSEGLYKEAARQGHSLTIDGVHLSPEGDKLLAPAMFRDVIGESAPEGDFEKLRASINQKNAQWHARYRTVDGYNVYGGRSELAYQPDKGGFIKDRDAKAPHISNFHVMQQEMTQRDVLTADADAVIWSAAQGKPVEPLHADAATLPPVDTVQTNHPGENPDKTHAFLGGEEAIAKMKVPAHCKVNLFASEEQFPELIKPVQMQWDTKGRLWVSAWRNYPERTPTSKVGDSILIFEDTDGDGKADKCTHFIDDLNCPTGFQFYKDGILLMQAPDLWFVRDTDHDGKADSIERVLMGLDSADSHHTTNSMVLEPGGATYLSDGVFHRTQVETNAGPVRNLDGAVYRYEPRTGKFECYVSYGFANPHGRVFDYWGNDIITDATGNASYFAPAFSGHIDFPDKHPKMNEFWQRPSRPCPGTGMMTSNHFPQEFWGNFLNCNVISFQGIYRVKVREEGSGLVGETLPDELVSSTDPNFRPVAVNVGPDGAIYLADWSNSIIGHMQHHLRDPNRDHVHGRIYRLTYDGRPLNQPPKIDGQPVPALLDLLKDRQDQVRMLAKIELGKHEAAEVIPALNKWAGALDTKDPAYEHHRTEALWVHQWFNVVDEDLLKKMLRSPDGHARAAATRVLCYWRDRFSDAIPLLKTQAADENPRVRLEAIRAASFFRVGEAADVALAAVKQPADFYITYCLKETMRQLQPFWRQAIADGKPVAADNPEGLAYLVGSLGTGELMKMPRTPAVLETILVRPGITDADRQAALVTLAEQRKLTTAGVLLECIAAKSKDSASLAPLAKMLPAQPAADLAAQRAKVAALTTKETPEIRQPAWAALAAADGSFDKAWAEASKSPDQLIDIVGSVPLVFNPDLRASMYDRVNSFLGAQLPPAAESLKALPAVSGRFIRIELPKVKKNVLNLAQVQVFSQGRNIAPDGKATQSSTDMSAGAERAIDGKTDGALSSNSVTHTLKGDANPWWEVDLGGIFPIDSVVVWPRTDDKGKTNPLQGFSIQVLDDARQPTFKKLDNPAAIEPIRFVIGPDGVGSLRRAAIRAAVSIQSNQPQTFATLSAMIDRGDQVPAAARGMRQLPPKSWSKDQAGAAANSLVKWAKTVPAGQRTSEDYVQTTQLAGDLAGLLPEQQAMELRKELKSMRVAVFVVSTVREQMRYDTTRLVVEAGKPFEIILENADFMPHNLAIVKPGSREKIGGTVLTMRPDELDSQGRAYIPAGGDVLTATKLVEAGLQTRLKFKAPNKEESLEYVCTFPGHWESMWGQLVITKDVDAYLQAHPTATTPTGAKTSAEHQHVH